MSFFELLQVALGNRERLSCILTSEEWLVLYNEAERQAITGILLRGLERLPAEQRPSQAFLLQWIGVGQMIQQQNRLLDGRCTELIDKIQECGVRGTILKGQGIARLYDKELQPLRQSGDIDVYVNCGLKKALAFAKSQGQDNIDWDYKHLHLNLWNDIEVEMHYRVEVLLNLWKNRKLQRWFNDNIALLYSNNNGFTTPTIEFNVFYILLHIYRHFLYEGVGLRQIVDYYFVLKILYENFNVNHNDKGARLILDAVRVFGMERFAKGLMWVMQEALGMQREWMLWESDEKEGRYILEVVMTGGNFGHYDNRLQHGCGKWATLKTVSKHNWHLMRHYPEDVIWAPVWFIWHKCWKSIQRIKGL